MKRIGETATKHGVDRNNHVWSWGGVRIINGVRSIVLMVWQHETFCDGGDWLRVDVLNSTDFYHNGGPERKQHIAEIDAGTPGYVILGYRKIRKNHPGSYGWRRMNNAGLIKIVNILPADAGGTRWAIFKDPTQEEVTAPLATVVRIDEGRY